MNKQLLLILLILILTNTSSHASNLPLPATGQTVCQDTGDDGAVQAGKSWPAPRFIDNHNGSIRDDLTGLVWSGEANPLASISGGTGHKGEVGWQNALDEIKRMNAEAYLGYSDWRLPNLNELASLVHQGEPTQNAWLNCNGFSNTVAADYWSSSSSVRDAARAWTVRMDGGSVGTLQKNGSAMVWPVRGGSGMLPATGQVDCFDTAGLKIECSGTGQDGELRIGVPWPAPRFSANGNDTITDNLTGLVWPQNANPAMDARIARTDDGSALWPDAMEFVTGLNNTSYLGFSDWRLPNRNELVSLVNYAETTPGVQLNMAGVDDIQERYWSSSSSSANSADAWNVAMNGEVVEHNKYDFRFGSYIWPVRGGIETPTAPLLPGETQIKTVVKAAAAAAATLSVTTTALPAGTVGTTYSQTLAATGGTTPYIWTRTTGTLPAGLTLSTSGVISGTPTAAGTGTFTVQVKDKSAKTATKSLSITVNAPAPLSVTTSSLSDGYLTSAYSQTLTATGGKTAYSWTIASGALPAGLSLAATTGIITGTPTVAGGSNVTVQVRDANNTIVTKPLTLSVYALPSITTMTLPSGSVGNAYSQILTASGGKATLTWSVSSGTLPAGLTLAAATGVISGTPTAAATSSVTFKTTDANAKTAIKALSITITTTPPSITTTALSDGVISVIYSQSLAAAGGKTPYTWSRTAGTLPAGLTLSSAGVISGKPTTPGSSSFTVQVKDANNAVATKALTITVAPPLSIATTELPEGVVGAQYSEALAVSGGKAPYTWSITSGVLPAGLGLAASTGVVSGTPATSDWSDFTVQVKDANNSSASAPLSMYINLPLTITTTSFSGNYIGIPFSQNLAATGGSPPYTWSITGGALPAGLLLDPVSGQISGTPTTTGTGSFSVQVRDGGNRTATAPLSIAIATYGSISGIVTDIATGTPLPGVGVTLKLDYTNKNPNDRLFNCNNVPVSAADYVRMAANDGSKFGCYGSSSQSTMLFKVRNPFGAADPFTVTWNGIGTLDPYSTEYIAQSFKPTRGGSLNKVSFYLPDALSINLSGTVRVLLKSRLGGDRGSYLAMSNEVSLSGTRGTTPTWVEFTFPSPVTLVAGENYYLEINGTFFEWYGGTSLYDLIWSGTDSYADGKAFSRKGGIWSQQTGSLAFRTYVNAMEDIFAAPSASTYFNMIGGNLAQVSTGIYSPATAGWQAGLLVNTNFPDSDGYHLVSESFNGDDLTGKATASTNQANYYDANGWLTVKVYSWDNLWYTNLTTDFFDITFFRTFTAMTDSNGAYSFAGLPDGNYTLTFDKSAYTPTILTGALTPGQESATATSLFKPPQSILQGTVLSSATSNALSGSTVAVTDSYGSHATQCDASGYFQQAGLHEGPFTATISNGGFAPTVITGILGALQTKDLGSIFLVPSTTFLPHIILSPGERDFGPVRIAAASSQNISVVNTGGANLLIGTIVRPPAPFWLVTDNCSGATLAPGASCMIMVQFQPTAEGSFNASFAIPSNDSLHPAMTVSLSGTRISEGYRLPHTGQTTCFYRGAVYGCAGTNGQDGNRVVNPISYEATSFQTARDNNTGLSWERSAGAALSTWSQASGYCQSLNLDGSGGWRLPTFVELMTIVNYGQANPAISSAVFPGTAVGNYWTATAETLNIGGNVTAAARIVNFGYGESDVIVKTDSAMVRCVKGSPLAHNGFYTMDANTTTDLDTGLMWTKPDFVIGTNWEETVSWSGMFDFAGYSDWRLPNIKELATYPYAMLHNSEWSSTTVNRVDGNGYYPQAFVYDTQTIHADNKMAPLDNNGYNLLPRLVRGGNAPPHDPWRITSAPAALDFGYSNTGASSTRNLRISNGGSGNLVIGAIPAVSTPFVIVADDCSGLTLAATAGCTVTVSFTSVAAGAYFATLTVPSNDADNPALAVPLIGSAIRTSPGIDGRVTDALTSQPLVAAITLTDSQNANHSTQSDAGGAFNFNNIASGIFSGVITRGGYTDFPISGIINPGQAMALNAALSPILPQLSNLAVSSITTSSAQINWTTDQPATTMVEYGETTAYGSTASDATLATTHSITLSGLKPGSGYHLRASSTNGFGNSATSPDTAFATPLFSATNLGDNGNVTVMAVAGNYDAKNPDSNYNDLPRKVIATEYFKNHPDQDFLIFLTTFDYAMPEATAQGFYLPVKNDIQGINQPIMDNTAQFGSAGKLQGTIDLGNISTLAANPYSPKLDETLTVLNHELMHRFGAYVRFKNPDGTLNISLLGKDDAHWSYLLDSKGSLMYGNGWKDNGDGTFTSVAKQSGYSPLDLYLMGMIPKEQVPPMLLIDNPAIDKTKLPHLGDTISGTANTVTINDIIAAEGERIPSAATAQKQFNVGFVLLTRAGDNATAPTQAIETLRKAWAGRFAELTQGKGSVANIPATLEIVIDTPADGASIIGPDVTVSGTVINSTGTETGVIVNGMPAMVSGSRFIVNHVSLQSGANSLVATATDANKLAASTTRNVTTGAGNYVRISSNIESGTGPLEVSLRVDGSFIVSAPVVSVTGPSGATVTPTSETEFTASFSSEGAYNVAVTATGLDGQIYTDSVTITVMSRYQLEALLKGKWDGMKTRVTAGDIQGALLYFPLSTRDSFQVVFNDSSIDIVSRLSEINNIEVYTLKNVSAQGGAIRQEDDGEYAYPLNFIRDEYGIWRICGF